MSILRQKKTHDKRLSYEIFNANDSVYVLFPVMKKGQSSKFPWFWKGPFRINKKVSDVLVNINCGRNGAPQDIHIDRVRKARKQILIGESEEAGMPEQSDEESGHADSLDEHIDVQEHLDSPDDHIDVAGTETTDEEEPFVETRHKRVVRKPRWMRDYLSVF